MPQSSDHPTRRAFLGSLMAAPLLTAACRKDYGRFFDIEWDEEVELHNGRIIIVHIKRTFERMRSMRYSRWKGMEYAIEIGFDAGETVGYYKRKFYGYDISYIEYSHGNWYISLTGLGRVVGRDGIQNIFKERYPPVLILMPDGTERKAESWSEVPYFERVNIMRILPNSEELSKFNKKLITKSIKATYLKKYPFGNKGNGSLTRLEQQPLPK